MKKAGKSLTEHWDGVYSRTPEEKLGWYETDMNPTMRLVSKTKLPLSAKIINIGAGNSALVDELVNLGYNNLIASDISKVALDKTKSRIGEEGVVYIVDDVTHPVQLREIDPVDLWIDRAVLHFFTEVKDQNSYFELLKSKIDLGGYVLMAEFNLSGATVCSGLSVFRYSKELLTERLGRSFELIDSFDHTYLNPSGGERPYIYALFRKIL